jgi:AcrR family transcriptional regulator
MLRHETTSRQRPSFDGRWVQLLDAAASVFSAEGYEGASMRRLAKEAKLSLAGVYHYVTGKEELLYWIQFDTFDSLLEGLRKSLAGVVDPRERLHTAVLNHMRHFGAHMDELKVCARDLSALEGEAWAEVHDRRLAYFEALHDLVKALPPKPHAPLDSWLATANLFGMLNWFYQWYEPARRRVSLDELAAQQTALFLGGYAADVQADRKDDNGSDR